MKIFYCLLVLLFISVAAHAQRITRESLWLGQGSAFNETILTSKGTVLASGVQKVPGVNTGYNIKYAHFTLDGDTLWTRTSLNIPTGTAGLVQTSDDKFAYAFTAYNSLNRSDLGLQRLDSQGHSMSTSIHDIAQAEESASMVLPASNNQLLVAFEAFQTTRTRFALALFDSANRVVWRRSYGWSNNDAATNLTRCADGTLVLAGNTNLTTTVGLKLLRVRASNGDSLRGVATLPFGLPASSNVHMVYTSSTLLPLATGHLIVTGTLNSTSGFVASFDSLLQPVWTYTYPPQTSTGRAGLSKVIERADGSLLVLGYTRNPGSATYTLHHLAAATGQLLGRYPLTSRLCQQMQPISLVAGPEDSIAFVTGSCVEIGNAQAYFARINLAGLRTVTATAPARQALHFQLFPNPATDQLTVRYPAEARGGELRLYSLLGQLLLTKALPKGGTHTLSVRELPAGTCVGRLFWQGVAAGPAQRLTVQR